MLVIVHRFGRRVLELLLLLLPLLGHVDERGNLGGWCGIGVAPGLGRRSGVWRSGAPGEMVWGFGRGHAGLLEQVEAGGGGDEVARLGVRRGGDRRGRGRWHGGGRRHGPLGGVDLHLLGLAGGFLHLRLVPLQLRELLLKKRDGGGLAGGLMGESARVPLRLLLLASVIRLSQLVEHGERGLRLLLRLGRHTCAMKWSQKRKQDFGFCVLQAGSMCNLQARYGASLHF